MSRRCFRSYEVVLSGRRVLVNIPCVTGRGGCWYTGKWEKDRIVPTFGIRIDHNALHGMAFFMKKSPDYILPNFKIVQISSNEGTPPFGALLPP